MLYLEEQQQIRLGVIERMKYFSVVRNRLVVRVRGNRIIKVVKTVVYVK